MSEIPEKHDRPAVLSYVAAKRGEIQPAHSRFTCEYHEDGLTLRAPTDVWEAISEIALGVILMLFGIVPIIAIYRNLIGVRIRDNGIIIDASAIICSCIAVAVGMVLLIVGRSDLGRPYVIEVRNGQLSRSRRSVLKWRCTLPVTSIVGIHVTLGAPTLPSGRLYSRLMVKRRGRFSVSILENRPKDECLWMARILREAMNLPTE